MNFKRNIYMFLAAVALGATACETLPDPVVEYSPVYPIAGEWKVIVKDETSGVKTTKQILRTYNTSNNTSDSVWVRLGTSTAWALLGKSHCDVTNKTFSVTSNPNAANANSVTFTVIEGKVLSGMAKVPSNAVTDSVFMRYSTTDKNGLTKTYTATGYRRTGFTEDE